jgi:hypothetical protein
MTAAAMTTSVKRADDLQVADLVGRLREVPEAGAALPDRTPR